MPSDQPICCPLGSLRALRVRGEDAAGFLHAQLTQDMGRIGPRNGALAAWLDARGRVRALFAALARGDEFILIAPAGIAGPVVADMSRYILRARVTLEVDESLECLALLGHSRPWLADRGVKLGEEAHATARQGETLWHRLGSDLVHATGPAGTLTAACAELPSADPAAAELAEIRLGIPTVTETLRDRFTPQMLNLDRLGAVAFDKGCYPGQEIVARAHHLGTVKRRMVGLRAGGTASTGDTILDAAGQVTGEVVRAATDGAATELLAVVQLAAVDGALRLGGSGTPLERRVLPYEREPQRS